MFLERKELDTGPEHVLDTHQWNSSMFSVHWSQFGLHQSTCGSSLKRIWCELNFRHIILLLVVLLSTVHVVVQLKYNMKSFKCVLSSMQYLNMTPQWSLHSNKKQCRTSKIIFCYGFKSLQWEWKTWLSLRCCANDAGCIIRWWANLYPATVHPATVHHRLWFRMNQQKIGEFCTACHL